MLARSVSVVVASDRAVPQTTISFDSFGPSVSVFGVTVKFTLPNLRSVSVIGVCCLFITTTVEQTFSPIGRVPKFTSFGLNSISIPAYVNSFSIQLPERVTTRILANAGNFLSTTFNLNGNTLYSVRLSTSASRAKLFSSSTINAKN